MEMRNKILNTLNIIVNATLSVCCCVSLALIFINNKLDGFNFISPYISVFTLISAIIAIHYNIKVYDSDEESVSKGYKIFHASVVGMNAGLVILLAVFDRSLFLQPTFITARILIPTMSILSFLLLEYTHKFSLHSVWMAPIPFFIYYIVKLILQLVGVYQSKYDWYYNLAIYGTIWLGVALITLIFVGINKLCYWSTFKKKETRETPRESIIIPAGKISNTFENILDQLQEENTEKNGENSLDNESIKANDDSIQNQENLSANYSIENVDGISQENQDGSIKISDEEKQDLGSEPSEEEEGKIYHISRHPSENKWQVKAEGASRAKKLFLTQGEAITYAKILVKTKGGSIKIHSLNGRVRNG